MSVREIPVTATATIGHRAYLTRPCGTGFVAVSADGTATVLDHALAVTARHELGRDLGDVSVTADGTTWAWAADGRLSIGAPGGPAKDEPLTGEVACRWRPDGQALWVAAGDGAEVRIQLRDPDHHVRAEAVLPDEFGDSMVLLTEHPRANAVVLWIAAGQDGQEAWLVTDEGTGLRTGKVADDCRTVLFSPDGTELITVDEDRIAVFSWPDRAGPRTLAWADVDPEAAADYGDGPEELVDLRGGHVAWRTGNGRLRVVDLATMAVVDEIALAGHPVRTVAEQYGDEGDENLCTDLESAVPGMGGAVLSVHGQNTLVLSALRDWVPAR